jgi:hypothetical protein
VFSDKLAHALAATDRLLPINAPGSATGPLPAPVYCPGLSGPQTGALAHVMATLPGHPCQLGTAQSAFAKTLST